MNLSPALYEVLYVSMLAPDQPLSVVAEIAAAARVANTRMDITGLLIFDGQRFCQQFEGPKKAVLKLIERIRNDPRHVNVEVLHHGLLAGRRFQNFNLAFSTVEDVDALARMEQLDGEAALAAFTAVCEELDY
ncbi:blue light sensor protein [Acidovorax sp. Leaf76]|uniref:BLUF domain-containing protein n=1 Tax=unclassified Acidovorax TaxID=2684926 RepID=UPI0006FD0F11|nr:MULTISPECIES: BLUF domain-containing protein [unclassified Acidovorax]KQO23826.1 blue light sensor protein [Acidovorax sp. Leaf76]KQO27176.1 blue light sensor protein [Acidovorax sp. Leaf78]KQO35615.1 blue light sensor protein [Acidovorax sp. Leaf84]KQS39857.1 blue light sensor protein [Acidovorax sp. Leaf191]